MPESRSDLLKISPELKSGRMWHDPQNCSFPELEESVSILSKVHPLQPEEKKVRQKTSTVAQMMVQQPQNIPVTPGLQPGVLQSLPRTPQGQQGPSPARLGCGGSCPFAPRGTKHRTGPGVGRGPYLAGCPWAGTGGLSFVRLSVLPPTARPEFAARDSWSYKVPTLLSMSTLITAGPADLRTQNGLEHWDLPGTSQRPPLTPPGCSDPSPLILPSSPSVPPLGTSLLPPAPSTAAFITCWARPASNHFN